MASSNKAWNAMVHGLIPSGLLPAWLHDPDHPQVNPFLTQGVRFRADGDGVYMVNTALQGPEACQPSPFSGRQSESLGLRALQDASHGQTRRNSLSNDWSDRFSCTESLLLCDMRCDYRKYRYSKVYGARSGEVQPAVQREGLNRICNRNRLI